MRDSQCFVRRKDIQGRTRVEKKKSYVNRAHVQTRCHFATQDVLGTRMTYVLCAARTQWITRASRRLGQRGFGSLCKIWNRNEHIPDERRCGARKHSLSVVGVTHEWAVVAAVQYKLGHSFDEGAGHAGFELAWRDFPRNDMITDVFLRHISVAVQRAG